VVYEVLSGLAPFAPSGLPVIIRDVLDGKRPTRPQGVQGELFTDDIWEMVERCWKHQPTLRPGLNYVLRCLQDARQLPMPPSRVDGNAVTAADDR